MLTDRDYEEILKMLPLYPIGASDLKMMNDPALDSTLSRALSCEPGDCLLYTNLGHGYEISTAVVKYRLANGV